MVRKLVIESMVYWTKEFKVDGFRYDLMGDLDGETVQLAFEATKELNPNIIKVGEGWRTYTGDDNDGVTPADQDWMDQTETVSVFSDEIRNELKSGFGSEGQPRFLTGGPRNIQLIYDNIIGKPTNISEDDPGDVLQYIAAHDNLTLHDVIAQSIQKDPAKHEEEIQKRIRLGNTMILTSQGVAFIHAGQEYGRTKQWLADDAPEEHYAYMEGFEHPYFIENSFNSSDAVNMFDWDKVEEEGIHKQTMEFTRGLIALRRSTDAFRLGSEELVSGNVSMIQSEDIAEEDLIIGFRAESTTGEAYYVFINADSEQRILGLDVDLTNGTILVDADEAGTEAVSEVTGVKVESGEIIIDPLTAVVIKVD
jgi:secreted pullulanase